MVGSLQCLQFCCARAAQGWARSGLRHRITRSKNIHSLLLHREATALPLGGLNVAMPMRLRCATQFALAAWTTADTATGEQTGKP